MDHLNLLRAVDQLYESVVMQPGEWNERAFADWAADVAGEGLAKAEARSIRRVLRVASTLQRFWIEQRGDHGETSWESRVDIAAGAKAWRPTLDLAMVGLEQRPDAELFEEAQRRFRLVNSHGWMVGVAYEDWLADRGEASI